jgi:hypothetical protein
MAERATMLCIREHQDDKSRAMTEVVSWPDDPRPMIVVVWGKIERPFVTKQLDGSIEDAKTVADDLVRTAGHVCGEACSGWRTFSDVWA